MGRHWVFALDSEQFRFGPVRLLRAQVPDHPSPFVMLWYSLRGEEQPYALRLDLDKRVVMDTAGDEDADERLRSRSAEVSLAIASEANKHWFPEAKRAHLS